MVLDFVPGLADNVISGAMSLDAAYEEARKRKLAAGKACIRKMPAAGSIPAVPSWPPIPKHRSAKQRQRAQHRQNLRGGNQAHNGNRKDFHHSLLSKPQKMALRVRASAIRRTGELLQEIRPSKGGRPPETRGGTSPNFTRTHAAREDGFSNDQRKAALRVAAVPAAEFDAAVEAAARRLGEMIAEQKATMGLDRGGGDTSTGSRKVPVQTPPTLADVGIDKKLSSQSQKLAAVPEDRFEGMLGEWRAP